MPILAPIFGGLLIVALFAIKAYMATPSQPAPTIESQQAQERERIIQRALDRAASQPTRALPTVQSAPQPRPGWPKRIVTRTWSSVGGSGETGHEAWSVAQIDNYRQNYRPDPTASETMRISNGIFYSDDEIVRYAVSLGIVVRGYTARQGSAIVPQRR